jgi:hypothetical protein
VVVVPDTDVPVTDATRPKISRADLQLHLDADAGCQVMNRCFGGQWWDWSAGSSLAFWRWNGDEQMSDARDGMRMYVKGTLPLNTTPQRVPKLEDLKLMMEKLDKVLSRGYISPGWVPKGEFDIRLVYDGTASGLNAALWAPSFWLPISDSAVRVLSFYSYLFDSDIGECFLNFSTDKRIRRYCGVDLTPFAGLLKSRPKFTSGTRWELWDRCFMGCKPSPHNAVCYLYLADEFCRGDRRDPKIPMRWDFVQLNLPGSKAFDPRLPRVFKWCAMTSRIAGVITRTLATPWHSKDVRYGTQVALSVERRGLPGRLNSFAQILRAVLEFGTHVAKPGVPNAISPIAR